jgi:integrase/recombinase XerD
MFFYYLCFMATFHPVLIHPDRAKKDGTRTILVRIVAKDKIRYLSIGYSVKTEHWNVKATRDKKNWILPKNPEYRTINRAIEDYLHRAHELVKAGKIRTVEQFKEALKGGQVNNIFDYFDKKLNAWEGVKSIGWVKHQRSVIKKLEAYHGSQDLCFQDIDYTYLESFYSHYKKAGNCDNTLHQNIKSIKRLFAEAIKDKTISFELMPSFAIKTIPGKASALTIDEVMKIMELHIEENTRLFHVRNIFLFSLFSAGINIKNALLLRWENIQGERLRYQRTKTGKFQDIALLNEAIQILAYYRKGNLSTKDFIFPFIEDSKNPDPMYLYNRVSAWTVKINRKLSELAEIAEIKKRITTHVNRHTFASISAEEGVPMETLKALLMHSDLKVTEGYIKRISTDWKDKALQAAFKKLKE